MSSYTGCASMQHRFLKRIAEKQYARKGLRRDTFAGEDGIQLVYRDSRPGDDSEGSAVLFLHGFTADKETWLQTVDRRLLDGYRVILVDLAGHGQSEGNRDSDYTVDAQADRVHQLVEKLSIKRVNLVGHSMGGAIAIAYTVKHSDHVESLALIASAGCSGTDNPDDPDQVPEEFKRFRASGANPLIISEKWDSNHKMRWVTHRRGPRLLARFANAYITQRDIARKETFDTVWKHIEKAKIPEDELDGIQQPTLIVWGDHDRILRPEMAEYYGMHIRGVQTRIVRVATGHMPMMEARKEITEEYAKFLASIQ